MARELIPAIKFNELGAKLERLLANYMAHREAGESLLSFTRRHEIAQLQRFCNASEAN